MLGTPSQDLVDTVSGLQVEPSIPNLPVGVSGLRVYEWRTGMGTLGLEFTRWGKCDLFVGYASIVPDAVRHSLKDQGATEATLDAVAPVHVWCATFTADRQGEEIKLALNGLQKHLPPVVLADFPKDTH